MRPLLAIRIPNYGNLFPHGQWHRIIDVARVAEEEGVERIGGVDHVVMSTRTDRYRWGQFPGRFDEPWLEPLTLLSAMSAVTTRARLATSILIATLRGPAVLAKTAATLDVISQGRLDLGVSTGWQREEYEANGTKFEERGQHLTDIIGACKTLWRDAPADFESPTVNFKNIYCEPRPLQPGGIPIWVAGTLHSANMERITRWADGWIPIMGETIEGLAAGVQRVRSAWEVAGRDPTRLQVQGPLPAERDGKGQLDISATLAGVPRLIAAGATAVVFPFEPPSIDLNDVRTYLRQTVHGFESIVKGL